ncbi:MAG: hypothetical protein KDB86_11720 [Actinobacteria bacterium]|nr:hypothetical protein [Actinomycetota bacterium]MCB9389307.1 hypothetical protein [Acidimicrobiia bacterium]
MSVLLRWFSGQLATRTRIRVTIVGVIGIAILGWIIASAVDDHDGGLARELGFGLSIPFLALVFGTSAFGDLIERQTLIYLWARPISRWSLAAAATLVAAALASVFAIILMIVFIWTEDLTGVPALLLATLLGTAAYAALFVALGARIPKALVWGSMFVLIWEATVAPQSAALSRLSVRYYVLSIVPDLNDGTRQGVSEWVAVAVLLVMAVGGVALTKWALSMRDIP